MNHGEMKESVAIDEDGFHVFTVARCVCGGY